MKKVIMILLFLTIIGTISVGSFSLSNIGILVVATIFLVVLVIRKDTTVVQKTSTEVSTNSQKTNTLSSEFESYGEQAI